MVIVLSMEHVFKTGHSKKTVPVCNVLRSLTSLGGHGVNIYLYFEHYVGLYLIFRNRWNSFLINLGLNVKNTDISKDLKKYSEKMSTLKGMAEKKLFQKSFGEGEELK